MMKSLKRTIAVILAALTLSLCFAGCSGNNAQSDTESSKADSSKVYNIGICQLVQHEALDAATQGFQDALKKLMGEDKVKFDVQNAQGDSPTCSTICNQFVSSNVDLIMGNGTAALQAAYTATPTIPVLGTSITDYGTALDIAEWTGKSGMNVSGTSDLAPLDKQAKMLKEAGLDRINHNLNSSRSFYHNICSTHTFDQRVRNIHMLQGLGFEICSGGIIGMGESKEDVVDMLLELREIQPEALPINFLLPIKGTPLGNADISQLTTEYCMKVLCLARLLVPEADIRCAAGREVYFKGEEKKLLSVVDSIFASGYLTEGGQGIEDTLKTITDAGFTYEIESA